MRSLGIGAGAAGTYIFALMSAGQIPTLEILKSTAAVFIGATGSYIVKNLLTNSSDQFLKGEKNDIQDPTDR